MNDGYESLRCVSGGSLRASAKPQKGTRPRRRNGIEIEQITGADLTDEHWDKFLNFTSIRAIANGAHPIDACIFDQIGLHGRRYPAHHGKARRALYCRCIEFYRRRHAVRANWGALKTIRFCILRFAIIRRLISPSNAACTALKRARRAHTNWRADMPQTHAFSAPHRP